MFISVYLETSDNDQLKLGMFFDYVRLLYLNNSKTDIHAWNLGVRVCLYMSIDI